MAVQAVSFFGERLLEPLGLGYYAMSFVVLGVYCDKDGTVAQARTTDTDDSDDHCIWTI